MPGWPAFTEWATGIDSVWTACVVVNPKLLLLGIGRTSVQDCLKQSIGQKSVHPTV